MRAERLKQEGPKNGSFYLVAIDGRGGSGKTCLAGHVSRLLPDFTLISGDAYFEPVEDEIVWGAFNDERFAADVVDPLRVGPNFTFRPYDWHAQPPLTEQHIRIDGGFCLERCFSFAFDLEWDLRLWVETPRHVCLERGLARELLPEARVLAAWRDVWQPAEDEYIRTEHPQDQADLVLDGTRPFEMQLS